MSFDSNNALLWVVPPQIFDRWCTSGIDLELLLIAVNPSEQVHCTGPHFTVRLFQVITASFQMMPCLLLSFLLTSFKIPRQCTLKALGWSCASEWIFPGILPHLAWPQKMAYHERLSTHSHVRSGNLFVSLQVNLLSPLLLFLTPQNYFRSQNC